MRSRKKLFLVAFVSLAAAHLGLAQTQRNWVIGADNRWSTPGNWSTGNVPDTNAESAANTLASAVTIDVDQNFTISNFLDGFSGEGTATVLNGLGVLTIDRNATTTAVGIDNATGGAGGSLIFRGNVTIGNSQSGLTTIRNSNSGGNSLIFDTTSVLTLNTLLQTVQSAGGTIQMNGTLASSGANLQVNSNNLSFGAGHDSSNFGRDIVFLANSKLAVNGGTVLNAAQKFQVNGTGAVLELNAANAINGANVVVGGSNNFLLDVNANQLNMGSINVATGILTIDIANGVTALHFANSSGITWGTGTVQIVGFQEGVIRFGVDDSGLTSTQLLAINGGIFSLDASGYLTAFQAIPEPSTYALLACGLVFCFFAARRRKRAQA